MTFKCPKCGGDIEAEASDAGQLFSCPHCMEQVVLSTAAYRQPNQPRSKIHCPQCGQSIVADAKWAGMEVTCPACQQDFRLPRWDGDPVVHWSTHDSERIRTFEETTKIIGGGGMSVSITSTVQFATNRQSDFLTRLGFSCDGLAIRDVMLLITRILRPIDYALKQTFRNVRTVLPKEHLRLLQCAIAHWDYCPRLPRFGPHATWDELVASGNDPHRS